MDATEPAAAAAAATLPSPPMKQENDQHTKVKRESDEMDSDRDTVSSSAAAPSTSSNHRRDAAADDADSSPSPSPSDSDSPPPSFVPFPSYPADIVLAHILNQPSGSAGWTAFRIPPLWHKQAREAKEREDEDKEIEKATKKEREDGRGGGGEESEDGTSKKGKKSVSVSGKKRGRDGDGTEEKKRGKRSSSLAKTKKQRLLEKQRAERERIIPEPGVTPDQSFQRLVNEVWHGKPPVVKQESKDAASAASDHSSLPRPPSPSSMPPDEAVHRLWEVPYISHFSWLFQKPLHLSPIEPRRMEEVLLNPEGILTTALFSELMSKLLFTTRAHFGPNVKRGLNFMGKGQRCVAYDNLCEWMDVLVQVWIEQHKQRKLKLEEENEDEEENEQDEGGGASSRKLKAALPDASKRRGPRRKDQQSDEDMSDEDASEETDPGAFNLHEISDRLFKIDTDELCGSVNPFDPDPEDNKEQDAAMTDGDAAINGTNTNGSAESPSASASSSSAASSAAAAAPSSSSIAAPSSIIPAPPPLSGKRKKFHELPLTMRAKLLKTLCDFQLCVNPFISNSLRHELESKELRIEPLGYDATGKKYFYFGFPDYRIYVQGLPEQRLPDRTAEEVEEDEREEREAKERKAEEARKYDAELKERVKQLLHERKEKAEAKAKEKGKDKDKDKDKGKSPSKSKLKSPSKQSKQDAEEQDTNAMEVDNIAPSSSLVTPSSPTHSESNGLARPSSLHKSSMTDSHQHSSSNTDAASSSTPSSNSHADPSSSPSLSSSFTDGDYIHPNGLPFTILDPAESITNIRRRLYYLPPSPPPFALLTENRDQIAALIGRLKNLTHPREVELISKLKGIVEELDEGKGRQSEEETKKEKQPAAPPPAKRVSDRLMHIELQREEMERLRLQKAEEESRARYTRRNRWLDEMAVKTIIKLRKVVDKLRGEDKRGIEDGGEEDEADAEVRRLNRRAERERRERERELAKRPNTRFRGKTTVNMAEQSSTETEDEDDEEEEDEAEYQQDNNDDDEEDEYEEDEDDEGCKVCGTVTPPEDGSNPIILCDKCDAQYCLSCTPGKLDRVPEGSWYCDECVAKYPRLPRSSDMSTS